MGVADTVIGTGAVDAVAGTGSDEVPGIHLEYLRTLWSSAAR